MINELRKYYAEKHLIETGEAALPGIKMLQVSIWSLLIELLDLFVLLYIKDGKFVLRFWHFNKHIRMLNAVWDFFERSYDYFKKKFGNDSE